MTYTMNPQRTAQVEQATSIEFKLTWEDLSEMLGSIENVHNVMADYCLATLKIEVSIGPEVNCNWAVSAPFVEGGLSTSFCKRLAS